MATVFGPAAAAYEQARPGYPPQLADVIAAYAGLPCHDPLPPADPAGRDTARDAADGTGRAAGGGTGHADVHGGRPVADRGGDPGAGSGAADVGGRGADPADGGEAGTDPVVEIGAGTGKGTEVFARIGGPLTCLEPDPDMAAILARKFPRARVLGMTFEQWSPPPGGVAVLACALAWHWLDPVSRCARAHAALRPGGTLAVMIHRYEYDDPAQEAVIRAALPAGNDRPPNWIHDDIAASGRFRDLTTHETSRVLPLPTTDFVALVGTFSPCLKQDHTTRRQILDSATRAADTVGGVVSMHLATSLVLARRA